MKPTLKTRLRLLGRGVPELVLEAAPPPKPPASSSPPLEEEAGRKQALLESLEVLSLGLSELGHEATAAEVPGTIDVQVVGSGGPKAVEDVPLPGLGVRVQPGVGTSLEARTDATGRARLRLPAAREPVEYEVVVLAPDGEVLKSQRGTLPPGEPSHHRLEFHYTAALGASFTSGRRWQSAVEKAVNQIGKLRKQLEKSAVQKPSGKRATPKPHGSEKPSRSPVKKPR